MSENCPHATGLTLYGGHFDKDVKWDTDEIIFGAYEKVKSNILRYNI